MANKKITELPLIFSGDISSNDVLPIVDVALDITNKITVDQLKEYFISGLTNTYITGGTFNIYSGITTMIDNFGNSFDITNYPVSNYKYIPSGVTITIPTNTQKFIYGDIIIDGKLIIEEDSELFVLNGNVIASGGTIVQFGDIVIVDLPEDIITINNPNTITIGTPSITETNLKGQVVVGLFSSQPIGVEGAIYYNTTTKKHYGFDGTNWNMFY